MTLHIKGIPVTATRDPRTPLMMARTSILPLCWKYDMKRVNRPPPNDDTIVVTVAFGKHTK